MARKYELTDETVVHLGRTLYRIRAVRSFGNVAVGDVGGFVEGGKNLVQAGNAWIYGNAQVYGDAQVFGKAQVSGDAWVYGNAQVSGDAQVFGKAQVYGDARAFGKAQVSGNARVYGNAQVFGNAQVSGNAWVFGDAQVSGNALVYGNAHVYGDAHVYGNAVVTSPIIAATRSDGYTFVCTPTKDGPPVIIAGCRYFTFDKAREYWISTRGGTRLGDESLALVDHLERMARIAGWIEADAATQAA